MRLNDFRLPLRRLWSVMLSFARIHVARIFQNIINLFLFWIELQMEQVYFTVYQC